MKRLKILVILSLVCGCSSAQIVEPRHWSWKAVQVSGDIYDLVFTMKIDTPWHGYSQYIVSDEGPLPTTISMDPNEDLELIGKTVESGPDVKVINEAAFQISLKIFSKQAIFAQRIKLKRPTIVKGSLEAQVCNDKQCLAPNTKDFNMKVGTEKKVRMVIEK